MYTYDIFFQTIKEMNITQYDLLKNGILDNRILNALKHNKNITLNSIDKLCNALHIQPNQVFTYTYEPNATTNREYNNSQLDK